MKGFGEHPTVLTHIETDAKIPTTPKGRRTREQILVAARRVFARDGYVKTRMSDVAEEADVSLGALYRYFSNKDDVFENLLGDTHERLYAASGATEHHFSAEPYQALLDANKGYLREYYENRDVMRVMVEASAVESRFREVWWKMRSRHVQRFIESLDRLEMTSDLNREEVLIGAEAMACMVEQSAYVWYANEETTMRDVPLELAARVLTNAWWGLLSNEEPPDQ